MSQSKYRTTIEYKETNVGWIAYEPAGDGPIGNGETALDAVSDYVDRLRDRE